MLAGGAHAWSHISCSILSYSIFLFSIISIKYEWLIFKPFTATALYCINVLLIIFFTPVDCKAKRITSEKKFYYKKRCVFLISILSIIFLFF